jgi:hypothetical protein
MNGFAMSIGERYVYYRTYPVPYPTEFYDWLVKFRQNPIPKMSDACTFRLNVALVTYGDDNGHTNRFPLGDSYLKIWKDELGLIVTAADKSPEVKLGPLSEMSFLKRSFVWDEEFNMYLPPLDLKSLARMLLFKRESVLSQTDHGATVLSEVLRESVYHGRAFYDRMQKVATELAEKYHLKGNGYLEIRSYDYWREKIRCDEFQTWSLREPKPLEALILDYASPRNEFTNGS